MKINLNKLYVVYTREKHSERMDVFDGRFTDIYGLQRQFLGGLQPKQIHGIYTTKTEAIKATDVVFKNNGKKRKAKTKKKPLKGYALFSDAVLARDKYKVTTPPKEIYPSRKAAQKAVNAIKKRTGRNPGIKIMTYDSNRR